MTSHYTQGPMTTQRDVGGCVGTALGHPSLGPSQFHGYGSWLMCEVALIKVASGIYRIP